MLFDPVVLLQYSRTVVPLLRLTALLRKPEEPIDAHSVQPYYTLLLAREANMTITIHATAEELTLAAA